MTRHGSTATGGRRDVQEEFKTPVVKRSASPELNEELTHCSILLDCYAFISIPSLSFLPKFVISVVLLLSFNFQNERGKYLNLVFDVWCSTIEINYDKIGDTFALCGGYE